MVGPSTGAVVRAALDLEGVTGLIVGISPDSGFKYTSYFAEILGDEGLPKV
jgi:cysteine synthase